MSRNPARDVYTTNNLSSHASLLLSASPTIITSQLQTNANTNHLQTSPSQATTTPPLAASPSSIQRSISLLRRQQPATPLLATANNLDPNLSQNLLLNTDMQLNIDPNSEEFINFKKPQNEIFKKLDGTIQKIVAAHSNLNKIYALNDFAGLGAKRPFELPPQLPPPPPWVPKLTSPDNSVETQSPNRDEPLVKIEPNALSSNQTPTIGSVQFAQLAQKIKLTLQNESGSKTQGNDLSEDDKKKFQENLIALLKKEISAVAKNADLKFTDTTKSHQNQQPNRQNRMEHKIQPLRPDQRSLLLKGGPQSLYNTIRRETTMLLNKRNVQVGARSSLSLLIDQPSNMSEQQHHHQLQHQQQQQHQRQHVHNPNQSRPHLDLVSNRINTVKVIIPPSESNPTSKFVESKAGTMAEYDKDLSPSYSLSYDVIKNKILLFQKRNCADLVKSYNLSLSSLGSNLLLKKKCSPQKNLDKIVDRLQAKRSPVPSEPITQSNYNIAAAAVSADNQGLHSNLPSLHQQIINSSASLIRNSRMNQQMSAPTPIPVFRSALSAPTKRGLHGSSQEHVNKVKSKKHKKIHQCFGLKISNYLEREHPQKDIDQLTIEQYALGLNLVPKNDASLQRRKEQLQQSEEKFRSSTTANRPMRLQRIRAANARRFI